MQGKIILTALGLMIACIVNAQTFTIEGRLTNASEEALPNATILLLNPSDSTMVNYGLSNNEGDFSIERVVRDNYLMRLSYVGYATRIVPVEPPEGDILDMGTIQLEDERTVLREVTVQEERVQMRVRGDTIEYDALAFTIQPNEVVEDLIRRMPGIEVEADGSIIAQGEQVQRVRVDGREFFGRDPRMATQNLPADAVSKVHVYDELSERAQFTGIDDGQRERTMNLELREDRREGVFGNTSLGYGPENRYQGRTNINHFNPHGQLSVLGMANNLNQQGFSIGEYMNFSGGIQGVTGGRGGAIRGGSTSIPLNIGGMPSSNGIMTSYAGGVNLNRTIAEDTDINVSYFYNHLDHEVSRDLERENFLPTGNYDFLQLSTLENNNNNHRLNIRADHSFDESNSILVTLNTSLNNTDSYQESNSKTHSFTGDLQNTSDQLNRSHRDYNNINTSLLYRRRLSEPGRTLTAGADLSYNASDQESRLEALNVFHHQEGSQELIMQDNFQTSINRSLGMNLSYTEPLGNNNFIEANYRLTQNYNEVDQQVYDTEDDEHFLNELLTNIYNNTSVYQRGGVNFRLNRDMFNLTIGSGIQNTVLSGEIITREVEIKESYFNFLPVVRFNYDFTSTKRLSANFETSVNEPGLSQLQPLVNNRDPLNIYEGNPDLRPSYRNRLSLRYNSFDPITSFGFFTFLTADYNMNPITNSVTVDQQLVRRIMPVNTDHDLSLRGNFNVNFNVSSLNTRVTLGSTLSHRQSTDILNDISQRINNNLLSGNIRLNFRPGDNFDTYLSANLNHQLTTYEFSTLEQAYLNQTYSMETNWNFLDNYRLSLAARYMKYEGRTSAFDQDIPMLEFGFSRRFLKSNSGELRLSGYNLLNRDLGVTQSADANYIERQVTNSLGRYFLLTFTYSLNRSLNVFGDGPRGEGRGRMQMIMQ